tara:strand:+ start:10124 stop:10510 length:387 start_codon:yes stop_codon:yes gene_type:complete
MMKLRVTEESDTYVYATSTLNFAGLEKEDMIICMFPMAMGSTLSFSPIVSFLSGIISLWLYKKVTKNQPSGFLILRCSLVIGSACNNRYIRKSKIALRFFKATNRAIDKMWIKSGLLPTPTNCNLYER